MTWTDRKSRLLLAQYRAGDQSAAAEIYNRYVERLIALTRSRLSSKLQRRAGAEDIVQSAYRSFFSEVEKGKVELAEGQKLWSLLATITVRKVYKQAKKQKAAKVNIDIEQSVSGLEGIPVEKIAAEPTPEEAVEITELLSGVMERLKPLQRRMLELHLQGETEEEIAVAVDRATRTVRRVLKNIEDELKQKLTDEGSDLR